MSKHMCWFWVRGGEIQSFNHNLIGEENKRCHAEGWHRQYADAALFNIAPGVTPPWSGGQEPLLTSAPPQVAQEAVSEPQGSSTPGELPEGLLASLDAVSLAPEDTVLLSDEDLLEIDGIGKGRLKTLRAAFPAEE